MRTDQNSSKTECIAVALIIVATIIAYIPAMRGGFIWDDPDYVTNNFTLRTAAGLADIWLSPRSLPQYYPMVHTTFWIEYQFGGLAPAGYHIDNILLHALAVILLWRLLKRLKIPGAWLAAGIFALHPVHVESVAWITERKNVLSAVFYFASFLAYLKATPLDGQATGFSPRWYATSLLLFAAALLSKSVTCSLPAAILLVIWLKRERITLRDLKLLAPFFVIGIAMALTTAWLERTHVGAFGREWDLNFIERCLIAGRAVWFYAMKLVAPFNLMFIYPRWKIDAREGWQYVYPVAAIVVLLALVLNRKRLGRGPAVVALFFVGTLLPALGFFNIYPMRYSFVADHFQYLASVGLIVLFAAIMGRTYWTGLILIPLAVLTWRQAEIYHDSETLWRATVERNEMSWMPHTNLGHAMVAQNRFGEAVREYERALELEKNVPETHWNVGIARYLAGDSDEALREYDRAISVDPQFAQAYFSRGNVYLDRGDLESAKRDYRRAIELFPGYAEAHFNLGVVYEQQKDFDSALAEYRAAMASKPDYVKARQNLARLLGH